MAYSPPPAVIRPQAARMSWYLTDLAHVPIAEFVQRNPGAEVEVDLSGERFASLSCSMEDDAARLVQPLETLLRVYLDDEPEPIFAGPVLRPRYLGDRQVEIRAIGPHHRLARRYIGDKGADGPDSGVPFAYQLGVDQPDICFRLMEYAKPTASELAVGIPSHGIVRGERPVATKLRDRSYEAGKEVWAAITDFRGILGGLEAQLQAVGDNSATISTGWRLDLYTRFGSNKSDRIEFVFGYADSNCMDSTYEPAGEETTNRAVFAGQATDGFPARTFASNQLDSQQAYGIYGAWEGRSDIEDSTTLAEHARGRVSLAAFPLTEFELEPAMEGEQHGYITRSDGTLQRVGDLLVPPRCHPTDPNGYWVGDTVAHHFRALPALDETLTARVLKLVIREVDDAGNIQVKPTCAPTLTATAVT